MQWFISKKIDSLEELLDRMSFYSNLTKCDLNLIDSTGETYLFSDGKKDNRCLIIGHTDTAFNVIYKIKNNSKRKYKFYLSVCLMSYYNYSELCKLAMKDNLYIAIQDNIRINSYNYLCCEYLEKIETGFGFRATRSELKMYNIKLTGFYNKLDKSFILIHKSV